MGVQLTVHTRIELDVYHFWATRSAEDTVDLLKTRRNTCGQKALHNTSLSRPCSKSEVPRRGDTQTAYRTRNWFRYWPGVFPNRLRKFSLKCG